MVVHNERCWARIATNSTEHSCGAESTICVSPSRDNSKFSLQHDRHARIVNASALQGSSYIRRSTSFDGSAAFYDFVESRNVRSSSASSTQHERFEQSILAATSLAPAATSLALAASPATAYIATTAKLFFLLPVVVAAAFLATTTQHVWLLISFKSHAAARKSSEPSASAESKPHSNGIYGYARTVAAAPAATSANFLGFSSEPSLPRKRLQQHLTLPEHAAEPRKGQFAVVAPQVER